MKEPALVSLLLGPKQKKRLSSKADCFFFGDSLSSEADCLGGLPGVIAESLNERLKMLRQDGCSEMNY